MGEKFDGTRSTLPLAGEYVSSRKPIKGGVRHEIYGCCMAVLSLCHDPLSRLTGRIPLAFDFYKNKKSAILGIKASQYGLIPRQGKILCYIEEYKRLNS